MLAYCTHFCMKSEHTLLGFIKMTSDIKEEEEMSNHKRLILRQRVFHQNRICEILIPCTKCNIPIKHFFIKIFTKHYYLSSEPKNNRKNSNPSKSKCT